MSVEDRVAVLTQQLSQKDDMLTMMKTKTKDYVAKLKDDNAKIVETLQSELSVLKLALKDEQQKVYSLQEQMHQYVAGAIQPAQASATEEIDTTVVELQGRISDLQEELVATQQQAAASANAAAEQEDKARAAETATATIEQRLQEVELQLGQSDIKVDQLEEQLQEARAAANKSSDLAVDAERAEAAAAAAEAAQLVDELETRSSQQEAELASLREQLQQQQAQAGSSSELVQQQEAELASLREQLQQQQAQNNILMSRGRDVATALKVARAELGQKTDLLSKTVEELSQARNQIGQEQSEREDEGRKERRHLAASLEQSEHELQRLQESQRELQQQLLEAQQRGDSFALEAEALRAEQRSLHQQLQNAELLHREVEQEKFSLLSKHAEVQRGLQDSVDKLTLEAERGAAAEAEQAGGVQGDLEEAREEARAQGRRVQELQEQLAEMRARVLVAENAQLGEAAERDDLQLALEDAKSALAAKEEAEQRLQQQVVQLQQAGRGRADELEAQLAAQLVENEQREREVETLTQSLSTVTQLNNDNKANCDAARKQLEEERAQNNERKRKLKVYVDGLLAEGKELKAQVARLEAQVQQHAADKATLGQRCALLEATAATDKAQAARDLQQAQQEWAALESTLQAQLAEKDAETRHLLLQVELASQNNIEEISATRARIAESQREMEAHKAKRLAARSEMINLARTLERAQADGDEIKTTVQYTLSPMVTEQISVLEQLVSSVEKIAFHLTARRSGQSSAALASHSSHHGSTSSTGSASSHSGLVHHHLHHSHGGSSPSAAFRRGGGLGASRNPSGNSSGAVGNKLLKLPPPSGAGKSGADLIEMSTPVRAGSGAGGNYPTNDDTPIAPGANPAPGVGGGVSGKLVGDMHSLGDALVQVEALRVELERVAMGLTLLALSVDKLSDTVAAPASCCGAWLDLLMPPAHNLLGGATDVGTGSYTVSSTMSPLSAYSRGDGSGAEGAESGGGIGRGRGLGLGKGRNVRRGYENLAGSALASSGGRGGNGAIFSIESNESNDDDEFLNVGGGGGGSGSGSGR